MARRLTKKQRRARFRFEHEQERRERRAERARRKREQRLEKLREKERKRRAALARHLEWLEYWRLHNRRGTGGAPYTADLYEEEERRPTHRSGSLSGSAGDAPAFVGLTSVRPKAKPKSRAPRGAKSRAPRGMKSRAPRGTKALKRLTGI